MVITTHFESTKLPSNTEYMYTLGGQTRFLKVFLIVCNRTLKRDTQKGP